MKTVTLAKSGATVLALGLATAAGVGAFGGWTDSDTAAQANQFGVVNLGVTQGGGTASLTTSFGTSSAPLAPGDIGYRYITLTNADSNAVTLSNVQASVAVGSVTDSVGTVATASDIGNDITVDITQCSVAWTESTNVCGGTTTAKVSSTKVKDMSSAAKQTLATSIAKNATVPLQIKMTVASISTISDALQGASATFTWTFTSEPRSAVTSQ